MISLVLSHRQHGVKCYHLPASHLNRLPEGLDEEQQARYLARMLRLAPALERLEKARHALKEGCWHLTYSKHKNACQAAKALGGIALPHDGKWAVVF